MLTFQDISDKLAREDEVTLLERLGITSQDIVDRFSDLIEANFESLTDDYKEEEIINDFDSHE